MSDNKYAKNVYNALKTKVQGFNKTEEEFLNLISTDSNYANNVHNALKTKVQGFNKTIDEFHSLVGVKKKEQSETAPWTSSQKPSDFPENSSMGVQPVTTEQTTTTEDSKVVAKPLPTIGTVTDAQEEFNPKIKEGLIKIAKEKPGIFSTEDGLKGLEKSLKEHGITSQREIEYYKDIATGGEKDKENTIIKDRQKKLTEDVFVKTMSTEGRRGIPYEAGDIPKSMDDLNVLSGAKKNYTDLMTNKLYNHVPEDMKMKAAIVQKQKKLVNDLKEGSLDAKGREKIRLQLTALEKELNLTDFSKKLYSLSTGEYVDQDKATPEDISFENKVQGLIKNKYSDLDKTYQAAEKASHLYDHYDDELSKEVVGEDGNIINWMGRNVTYRDIMTGMQVPKLKDADSEKAKLLREKYLESKANVEAISRAIMLNEDPSQIKRGFFGDAGLFAALGKGFNEAMDIEKTTDHGEFATRFVDVINRFGDQNLLTKAQVTNAKETFGEKVSKGIGASLPTMGEIAIASIATEGVGTIPVIARRLAMVKKLFGTSKAGKLAYNILGEGVKGYISYAPTSETGATGLGEGMTQGALDTFMPEKFLGGKYGKLVDYGIRTLVGGTTESIQESVGGYFNALSENGFDAKKAFYDAFGRTPEERWEYLSVLGTTSLLFSGAFNSKRLIDIKGVLEKEIDNGSIPSEDIKEVQEIIKNIDDKIKSEEVTKTDVPNVPNEIKTETSAVEKIKVTVGEVTEEITPEELTEKLKDKEFVASIANGDTDIQVDNNEELGDKVVEAVSDYKGEEYSIEQADSDIPVMEEEVTTDKITKEEQFKDPLFRAKNTKERLDEKATHPGGLSAKEKKVLKKANDFIKQEEAKTKKDDSKNGTGISSTKPKGETSKQGEPDRSTSTEEVQTSGVQSETIQVEGEQQQSGRAVDTSEKQEKPRVSPKKATVEIAGKETELVEGTAVSVNNERKIVDELVYKKKKDDLTGRSIKDENGEYVMELVGFKTSKRSKITPISDISEVIKTKEDVKAEVKAEPVVEVKKEPIAEKKEEPIVEKKKKSSDDYVNPSPELKKQLDELDALDEELDSLEATKKDTTVRGYKELSDKQKVVEDKRKEVVKEIARITKEEQAKTVTETSAVEDVPSKKEGKKKKVVDTKESLLKELSNLRLGDSPMELFKRAKEIGVHADPEYIAKHKVAIDKYKQEQDAIGRGTEAHKKKQEEAIKEIERQIKNREIGEGGFFQTESRLNSTEYLIEAVARIKKMFPNLKVVEDTTLPKLGAIIDGVIYINPLKAKRDTPFHEVAHVFIEILKSKNPQLYAAAIELTSRDADLMGEAAQMNPHLTDKKDIAKEALVMLIGEKSANTFKKTKSNNIFVRFFNSIANIARKIFNIKPNVTNMEVSDMKLKDLVGVISSDLMSGRELSTITETQLKELMEGRLSSEVVVDSTILSSELPSGSLDRFLKSKGVQRFKGAFRSRDILTQSLFNIDNNTRSKISATLNRAGKNTKVLQKEIAKFLKSQEVKGESKADRLKRAQDFLQDTNALLTKDMSASAFANVYPGSDAVIDAVTDVRDMIDEMSQILAQSGYVTGETLAKINENIGIYITRSYAIHKAKPSSVEEWLASVPKETRTTAEEWWRRALNSDRVKQVTFEKTDAGNYKVVMTNDYKIDSKPSIITRAELESLLHNKGQGLTIDEINQKLDSDKESVIDLDNGVIPSIYGIKFEGYQEDIDRAMHELIEPHIHDESSSQFAIKGINKKNSDQLKKRQDIPKELRELLGEIEDPVFNVMETVAKMSSLIEYSKMLGRIKTEGKGILVWDKKDAPTKSVPFPDTPRWKPLSGMYTTPELFEAIERYEKDGLLNIENSWLSGLSTSYFLLNSMTKAAMTKWNPGSNARNHYGAVLMGMRSGYFNPIDMFNAYTDYWSALKTDSKKSEEILDELEMMAELGLLDDSVGVNIYKESFNKAVKRSDRVARAKQFLEKNKLTKGVNTLDDAVSKFYQAPDAGVKIFLFRKLKADYRGAYGNTITEEALNEKVANQVKDVLASYSRMSKVAKALSRNPIFGAFASFTTEMVRGNYNQIKISVSDIKEGVATKNPKLIQMGVRRSSAQLVMTAIIPAIASYTKYLLGVDDEEEREMRSNFAPWERDSWVLWLGRENGSLFKTDLSYTDPQAVFTKPLFSLISAIENEDNDAIDVVTNTILALNDQFLGQEPFLKSVIEASENKNQYGAPIAREEFDEGYLRVSHILKSIVPKVYFTLEDSYKVATGKSEENEIGKKFDPLTFMLSNYAGVRVQKQDMVSAVKYKVSRDTDRITIAKNRYSRSDKTQEDLDEANRLLREIFDEQQLNIRGAIAAGATKHQVLKALKEKKKNSNTPYASEEWIKQLKNNRLIPLTHEKKMSASVPSYRVNETLF